MQLLLTWHWLVQANQFICRMFRRSDVPKTESLCSISSSSKTDAQHLYLTKKLTRKLRWSWSIEKKRKS